MRFLIICVSQFGYHLDTYYYCKHGKELMDITYIGFKGKRKEVKLDGIRVKYISYSGNKLIRYIRWIYMTIRECRKEYDVVFVKYFIGCSLIRLFANKKKIVVDIRTGSIAKSFVRRLIYNHFLVIEANYFKNITVISESLANKLNLKKNNYFILPLGADISDSNNKSFDYMHILYVGTLSGREIEKTIIAFKEFYSNHKNQFSIKYTIVGDGYKGELEKFKKLVNDLELVNVVYLQGFLTHQELVPFWKNCNIGVSFIPINDIYNCQPSTKTYEYLLSGMPVIATNTEENKRIINDQNGVLIDDTISGFASGLEQIYKNHGTLCSDAIKKTAESNQWEKIINNMLYPYLKVIVSKQA